MKKLICTLMLLCLWVPLCGFTSISAGTISYSGGAVREVVSFAYNSQDAQALGTTMANLNQKINEIKEFVKLDLNVAMLEKIAGKEGIKQSDFVVESVLDNQETSAKFSFVITYKTSQVYKAITNLVDEDTTTTLQKTLFLKKYITQSPIKLATFDVLGVKKNLMEFVYDEMCSGLQIVYPDISGVLTTSRSFTYTSSITRLHTNASQVEKDPNTTAMYYTWNYDTSATPTITLWQVHPNVEMWYCLAIGLTGVLALSLWLIARKKQRAAQKQS